MLLGNGQIRMFEGILSRARQPEEGFFLFTCNISKRCQICIARCFYSYRNDLPEIFVKPLPKGLFTWRWETPDR